MSPFQGEGRRFESGPPLQKTYMHKVILFAGPIGSSKTPIAHYLSHSLNLPIFNQDTIRLEVQTDLLRSDVEEYIKRRDERIYKLVEKGIDFIYDASVDRSWEEMEENLEKYGYDFYLISIDISKEKLEQIYSARGADIETIEQNYKEHKKFLEKFSDRVNLHITDENFKDRLEISLEQVSKFLGN